MKTLEPKRAENKAEKAAVNGSAEDATVSAPSVQIDLSKVKIEPLFADDVDFETFSKSDFRVVKIEACEAVPKSKKLLKFTLNDGTDRKRTILSGIHEYYEPEELVGKTCVAITNLPPRKMMGIDSEGMLISAVYEYDGREGLVVADTSLQFIRNFTQFFCMVLVGSTMESSQLPLIAH